MTNAPDATLRLTPAQDLPLLGRWLPELSPRSPAIVRATGTAGHTGSTASAHGGRLDRVDASQGYRRAVAVWRRVRDLAAAGAGRELALLWAAYVLAQPSDDGMRAHRFACDAVATGAAPRVLREEWRARAAEKDCTRTVEATLMLPDGVDADGDPKHREVIRRSTAILSTKGPGFEALAVAWGREGLRPLWAPGEVPSEVALRTATGFAPPPVRAAWEKLRGPLRGTAERAWGEGAIREAEWEIARGC